MATAELQVRREARFDASPEQIWPLIDDPAAMGRWFAFAERMELLDGQGTGRVQRLHGHWGRRRSEIDQEIIAYTPLRVLGWRHLAERLDGKPAPRFSAETVFTITITPDAGGARVQLESRQLPASFLRGLVMRLFGNREIAEKLDESLTRLRATLQS